MQTVPLDLIIYSYVYVKYKKMEHPDTEVLIFISFHSSVFAVFVWLVVMFAGIPIQFNLCVLVFYMRSQALFLENLYSNWNTRTIGIVSQVYKEPSHNWSLLPLLSSDTSMFPAQTRREDTREVMIFFNKKNVFLILYYVYPW